MKRKAKNNQWINQLITTNEQVSSTPKVQINNVIEIACRLSHNSQKDTINGRGRVLTIEFHFLSGFIIMYGGNIRDLNLEHVSKLV